MPHVYLIAALAATLPPVEVRMIDDPRAGVVVLAPGQGAMLGGAEVTLAELPGEAGYTLTVDGEAATLPAAPYGTWYGDHAGVRAVEPGGWGPGEHVRAVERTREVVEQLAFWFHVYLGWTYGGVLVLHPFGRRD